MDKEKDDKITVLNSEEGKASFIRNYNKDKTTVLSENDEGKIDSKFYKDPISFEKTIHETDFDLKKLFPDRTKTGHVKINRNFLKDAEPFTLERLSQETKDISEGVFTGFNCLDIFGSIKSYKPLVFYGLPRKEISILLLNILVNLTNNYSNKHFLYYTYSESRIDMEYKLINVLSESAFKNKKNLNNNLEQWIYEIGTNDLKNLIEKVKNDSNYSGLRNFIKISDRIHIIDGNYSFNDLHDSIKSFSKVFDIGAVIIDNGEEIIYKNDPNSVTSKVKYISDTIRKIALELNFPFFYGYIATDEIRKDGVVNINFINYSTRVIKIRKEYPKISLIDNDSGKETTLKIDYDMFKIYEE